VFGHKIRQKSALRSGIIFASTEVMHKPRYEVKIAFIIIHKEIM